MYPGSALAERQSMDATGVVHQYRQALDGEAMLHGPIMLSWQAVRGIGMGRAGNVVIHEMAHKIDMKTGVADGAPPLPANFMGAASAHEAAQHWAKAWGSAYADFQQQIEQAERFAADWPWLNPYAATAPAEFFAVACEAHFVVPGRFASEFPELAAMLRAFFKQQLGRRLSVST